MWQWTALWGHYETLTMLIFLCYKWYLFRWYIVHEIWYSVHFPCFLFNCNWRQIKISCREWKTFCREKRLEEIRAEYFQNGSTLFSKIWTHWLIVIIFYEYKLLFLFPLLCLSFTIWLISTIYGNLLWQIRHHRWRLKQSVQYVLIFLLFYFLEQMLHV